MDLDRRAGRSFSILLDGMANPMFWACEVPSALDATAVFMPMTRPELSTRGPPEFPGLMAASVWNMLVRFSVEFPEASLAWTDRPLAEMIPWVTVGVPADSPRALPMATTASPTCTLSEFP